MSTSQPPSGARERSATPSVLRERTLRERVLEEALEWCVERLIGDGTAYAMCSEPCDHVPCRWWGKAYALVHGSDAERVGIYEDARETIVHHLCAFCGHSESSHSSRVESRARGNDVGSKGGVYRCQHCSCPRWSPPVLPWVVGLEPSREPLNESRRSTPPDGGQEGQS